jgi:hypothetical protein
MISSLLSNFFLSLFKEKLLTYLQEVSDRIDREEENSAVLQAGLPIKTHPKKTKSPPKKNH